MRDGVCSRLPNLLAVEQMQFLARLETHRFARSNRDLGSSARVAADTGLARTDIEDAKAAQFDTIAVGQGLLEAFEDGVDRGLCLDAREAGPLNDVVDDVLFNQCFSPGISEIFQPPDAGVMLERFFRIVNACGVS
jgi:hypothetical protein